MSRVIARFKTRWVIRGYLQQFKIDFNQLFTAVIKLMAFKVIFTITIYYDLDINQIDIKTAFLYRLVNQLVYIQIQKSSEIIANKEMVCKLLRVFYNGFKQTLRLWYKGLFKFLLKKLGLKKINEDYSIFVSSAGINGQIISTFINNIKVMGIKRSGHIKNVKKKIAAIFEMVDMGPISFYLGLKVEKAYQKKRWSFPNSLTLTKSL